MSPKSVKKQVPSVDTDKETPENTLRHSSNRNRQLKVLYRISDLINSTVNNTTLLRRIVRETVDAFDASGGLIAFADGTETTNLKVEVDQRLDSRNLRTGTVLPADHIGTLAFNDNKVVQFETDDTAVKSEMAAPLRVEGKTIGVLCVRWRGAKKLAEDDVRLLSAIAGQAARIIHTSRLYERLSIQTERLESLFEIGQTLISTDPLPEVLNRVTASLLSILDVKQCTVLLVGKGHDLQLSASSGGAGNYTQRRELSDSLVQKLSSRGEPVRVLDVKKSVLRKSGKAPTELRQTTLLAVPIFYQQNLVGILNVYTGEPRHFESEEMRLLKSYASLCGVAIANARQHERLLSAAEEIRVADRANSLHALTDELGRLVRNPLASTRLILDTLRDEGVFPPEYGSDYETLMDNISIINQVVRRAQELSARRPVSMEWIDINQTVEDVLSLCRHRLAARQIMLNKRLGSDLPRLLVDRGELQQVILHSFTNAMDAMGHGGILNVSTTILDNMDVSGEVPMVRINIRDTGPGLDPSGAEDIFDPFARESSTTSGFGLFVAWKIVQKYGGRLTVRNASDHGTSVSITLPALENIS